MRKRSFVQKLDESSIEVEEEIKVDCDGVQADYNLHSVLLFRGSLRYGHYVSLVRTSNDIRQDYALFNDETVHFLSASIAKRSLKNGKARGFGVPYGIVYEKTS